MHLEHTFKNRFRSNVFLFHRLCSIGVDRMSRNFLLIQSGLARRTGQQFCVIVGNVEFSGPFPALSSLLVLRRTIVEMIMVRMSARGM